jgi:hypothetical protein
MRAVGAFCRVRGVLQQQDTGTVVPVHLLLRLKAYPALGCGVQRVASDAAGALRREKST